MSLVQDQKVGERYARTAPSPMPTGRIFDTHAHSTQGSRLAQEGRSAGVMSETAACHLLSLTVVPA